MTYQPHDQLDMEMMLNDLGVINYYPDLEKAAGVAGSENSGEHRVLPLFFQAQSTPQTDLNQFYSLLNQQLAFPESNMSPYMLQEKAGGVDKFLMMDKPAPSKVHSASEQNFDKISTWFQGLGIEEKDGVPCPPACYTTAYSDDYLDPRLEYCNDENDIRDYQAYLITKEVIERYHQEKEPVCYGEVLDNDEGLDTNELLIHFNTKPGIGPVPNLRVEKN